MKVKIGRTGIFFVSLLFAISAACFMLLGFGFAKAEAKNAVDLSLFLPFSESEYRLLNTPKDLYADGNIIAINLDSSVLLVYDRESGFSSSEGKVSFTALNQIKKLDANNLLVTDDGSVYKLSTQDFTKTPLTKNETTDPTGGTYFDYNGRYLVTTYSGKLNIYTIDGTKCTSFTEQKTVADNSPVAINSQNEIFYIADGKICKRFGENFTETNEIVFASPEKIAADETFVYFIEGNTVKRVNIDTKEVVALSVESYADSERFNLGNLVSPSGLCLSGDKILVSDASGSVQEFSVENEKLVFTGYAIAKNKTAYNRIEQGSSDIRLTDGKLAVYKSGRLTVINDAENPDYSRANFENYFSDAHFGSFTPDSFALGENSALLADSVNRVVKKFDYEKVTASLSIENGGQIVDVAYRGGYFYVYLVKGVFGNNSFVYRIEENSFSSAELVLSKELYNNSNIKGLKMTVDLIGNVYLSSSENGIFKYSLLPSGEYDDGEGITGTSSSGLLKMETDLSGALFILYSDRITVYNGETLTDFNLDVPALSFCISHETKNAFIIAENDERIYVTEKLPNTSLDSADIPADYTLRGESAEIYELGIYSAKKSANVYKMQADESTGKFAYNGNAELGGTEEFLFICRLVIPAPAGGKNAELSLYTVKLKGNDEIVAIDDRQTDLIDGKIRDAEIPKAYVGTSVSAYYYPVITEHDDFCLLSGETTVRLKKGTPLSTLKTVTFSETPYYYASFVFGGKTVYGYVPINFTVEILSQYDTNETFVIKKVKATKAFSDDKLTEYLSDLSEDTEIKLYYTENGASSIAFRAENGNWIKCFVSAEAIKNVPDNTVRNVLIIVCVAAAVASTSIFFILRKKD